MKYMIIQEMKDPFEENYAKAMELEKKRQEKGDIFTIATKAITSQYIAMRSPIKTYMVVDCDPEDAMKLVKTYAAISNIEIIPVIERQEWDKI